MYDWEPPGEHMPGHMLATTIGTPRLGEEVEVPSFVERDTRRVEWIASPPLLAGVWFQVWLSERDEPPATGGKARRPPFRLPDGRFVWITVTERELTVGEVRDLTATRENVKVPMTGKQRPGKPPRGTFATIWDIRDKAESPFITQLVPTPRNFVYEG